MCSRCVMSFMFCIIFLVGKYYVIRRLNNVPRTKTEDLRYNKINTLLYLSLVDFI